LWARLSITILHEPSELSRRDRRLGVQAMTARESGEGFNLLTAKACHGEVDEREWTYMRRDGSTFPVHVAVTAVRDGAGEVSGFIAIASDIYRAQAADDLSEPHGLARPAHRPARPHAAARAHRRGHREGHAA
jgi:PAS domain-containing protein